LKGKNRNKGRGYLFIHIGGKIANVEIGGVGVSIVEGTQLIHIHT